MIEVSADTATSWPAPVLLHVTQGDGGRWGEMEEDGVVGGGAKLAAEVQKFWSVSGGVQVAPADTCTRRLFSQGRWSGGHKTPGVHQFRWGMGGWGMGGGHQGRNFPISL